MILPQSLEKGSEIAIITPSGAIEPLLIDDAVKVIQREGFNVSIDPLACTKTGRFAGSIAERVNSFRNALSNPSIKAILCSRGGYGIVHLLPQLNPDEIRKNPKWIIGYSDITALHAFCNQAGLISMHAPMCKHLSETDGKDKSSILMFDLLKGVKPEYSLSQNALNRYGDAEGTLIGGNLAVLCGLRGTPYDITSQFNDPILFIEDIGEHPYQIDRMIYNLELGGVLNKIKALIVGEFNSCTEDPLMYDTIYGSIRTLTEKYDIPVIFDFPVGHGNINYPMLCGARVQLTKDKLIFI
ncbi:MAG: S66 peptidase family protein [Bacteroidales bacterium]